MCKKPETDNIVEEIITQRKRLIGRTSENRLWQHTTINKQSKVGVDAAKSISSLVQAPSEMI
jgi:hypothetical protein